LISLQYQAISLEELKSHQEKKTAFETFIKESPRPDPSRANISGVICGIRVEHIEEPLMEEIRYPDKTIDELAKGTAMKNILRT